MPPAPKRSATAAGLSSTGPKKAAAARPRASGGGSKSALLKTKSPAEFFAENKNIAGFDNPGKSLYTTLREFVENGLDAAESVPVLPDISVEIAEVSKSQFRALLGSAAALPSTDERLDTAIYKDVETDKERKLREKKEAAAAARASTPADPNNTPAAPAPAASARANLFRVTVTDNGIGMPHDDLPEMLGRVLTGTKYCVKQSRGKFGLGSKMALIWAKMSTGMPVEVVSAMKAGGPMTKCVLDIDIARNEPNIISLERVMPDPGAAPWRGTKISVVIEGNWTSYRAKILQYMRQIAVITPHALFRFAFTAEGSHRDKSFAVTFARRSDKLPPSALEVKHHPSSVNQLLIKQIIDQVKPSTSLLNFLSKQLSSIDRAYAKRLIAELAGEFTEEMPVSELDVNRIRQLDHLLHQARFEKPTGSCLSPAGEYNLRLGIMKELKPDLVATFAEPADVFEGHPFIVEAGVSLGGQSVKQGINVYRFANRIPLLFEAGSDVVSRTAVSSILWSSYKISPTQDKIGVFCSIVSTKIPFKGTSKEYIGDDSPPIKNAVKHAISQCCLQLKAKLKRKAAEIDRVARKKTIARYVPDVANAVMKVLESEENPPEEVRGTFDDAKSGVITREVLTKKLLEHLDRVEKEFVLQAGEGKEEKDKRVILLAPIEGDESYVTFDRADESGMGLSLLRSLEDK